KSKLETGVKIAAGNAKVMDLIQGVHVGEPEAEGGGEEAEAWKVRWAKVSPQLKEVLKAKGPHVDVLQKMAALALERAEKEDYKGALGVLEKLEPQLVDALKPASPPVDKTKLKEMVGKTTGTVDDDKKKKYEEKVEKFIGKSEMLARHLDDIL